MRAPGCAIASVVRRCLGRSSTMRTQPRRMARDRTALRPARGRGIRGRSRTRRRGRRAGVGRRGQSARLVARTRVGRARRSRDGRGGDGVGAEWRLRGACTVALSCSVSAKEAGGAGRGTLIVVPTPIVVASATCPAGQAARRTARAPPAHDLDHARLGGIGMNLLAGSVLPAQEPPAQVGGSCFFRPGHRAWGRGFIGVAHDRLRGRVQPLLPSPQEHHVQVA